MLSNDRKQIYDISSYLILNAPYMTNLGLFHGKMGVIIFLYIYSRYTKLSYYEDFAGLLLDDLFLQLNTSLPACLEHGLAGIGWSLEYLIQNEYLLGNTNEILYDLDLELMTKVNVKRLSDESIQEGIAGLIFYVLTRLSSPARDLDRTPFDDEFISALILSMNKSDRVPISKEVLDIYTKFKNYIHSPYINTGGLSLPSFLLDNNMIGIELSPSSSSSLGLYNGIAGAALKHILL